MIEPTITASAPDPARQTRLRRVRLLSLVLARCFVALAVLLTLGLLFYWLTASAGSVAADANIPQAWLSGLGLGRRLAGFAISFVPLACLVFALMAARRAFQAFATGDFFGQNAIRNLRYFGLGLLASALLETGFGSGAVRSPEFGRTGRPASAVARSRQRHAADLADRRHHRGDCLGHIGSIRARRRKRAVHLMRTSPCP